MEDQYFMDDRALVLEHTLLTMPCDSPAFTLPAEFGSHAVTTVGSGALQIENVQELTIAPGYTELKECCLGFAKALKRLYVPETAQKISSKLFTNAYNYAFDPELYIDRALSPALFLDLQRNTLPLAGKGRLLPPETLKRGEMEPVRCLMHNSAQPAAAISRDMRILFYGHIDEAKNSFYSGSIFDPRRPCLDFISGRESLEEYTAVMEMIRDNDCGYHDPSAEQINDWMIRKGEILASPRSCLPVSIALCEEMPDVPGLDGLFHMRFHLFRKILFFPALHPLRHRGTDWWIYSRNYLNKDADRPYIREDVGVFDRNGLVTDRTISEDVYAKYRFLTIL